jgi:hypothetical protein
MSIAPQALAAPTLIERPPGRPMLDYETKEKVRKGAQSYQNKSCDDWGRQPNGNPSRVAVAKSTSDYLTRVANEPSVGLYHVQDHIRRSIPKFVDIQVLVFFLLDCSPLY